MKLNQNGYNLIKQFEGLRLDAYAATESEKQRNIWTIGFGNITYENGTKVKKGDKITQQRAEELFKYFADRFASNIDTKVTVPITQNQFNAIVSLAYNIGLGNFQKSTLLKKLNRNPNDKTIKDEFLKWINAGGRKLQGLVNRRKKEIEVYFS